MNGPQDLGGQMGLGPVAPEHAAYWRDLEMPGYGGGPFADK